MAKSEASSRLDQLPASEHYFSSSIYPDFWALDVIDKFPDGVNRPLPRGEMLCLGLQECGVFHGFLSFFHLRNHESWKKSKAAKFCPPERQTTVQDGLLSNISCMLFKWNEEGRENFRQASHLTRYDLSSIMLNAPQYDSPFWSIQFASAIRHKLFDTDIPSLIVLASPEAFYLLDTVQYRSLIGRWGEKTKRSSSQSNKRRFDIARWLWTAGGHEQDRGDGGDEDAGDADPFSLAIEVDETIVRGLEEFRVAGGVEQLYLLIRSRIVDGLLPATMTCRDIFLQSPRPGRSDVGDALGMASPSVGGTD